MVKQILVLMRLLIRLYTGTDESSEECRDVLRRRKGPQGKSADPINREHRGFFPFLGESSVFFFVIEAFGTNAQPASGGCSTQRVWDYPNKHFAEQKWRLYIRTPCLPQQCELSVRIQLLSVLVKHECYQEENHSNPHEPRDNFLLMKLSESQ